MDWDDNPQGPVLARSIIALDEVEGRTAVLSRRELLLCFDADDAKRPIILGWLDPRQEDSAKTAPSTTSLEAKVDGKRVVIDAAEEIVLRCGQASITLRRNGRVVITGTYVETVAEGVNRVKGGSVQIN